MMHFWPYSHLFLLLLLLLISFGTMALPRSTAALVLFTALASASVELARSISVKGSVSCVDCSSGYDYSGISILVKCDEMKKPALARSSGGGSFEAKLALSRPAKCKARLLGGPKQLYALNKNMVSTVIRVANAYTAANTMTFASSCSSLAELRKCPGPLASSKTIDLPIPPEYGLPPTSYYLNPFLPIIGIP